MVLAQSRQNMTDHPKLLLREESHKDTASVWVLIKLNQTHLASLLAVPVQLSFVQIKSRCRRSVSTAQPLPSHPSALQHQDPEGHTQQDRETAQGYPMSPPWQCHLWLTIVFWLNWSFCTASMREACGLHKPCASPCVGLSGGELCHWHREFILWAFPHLKLESQPFHCSLMFSWTYHISIDLKSLLLPVH